jgi:hypothetical protein
MPINTLTDSVCKRAVAQAKPVKLFDGHGLFLFVTPPCGVPHGPPKLEPCPAQRGKKKSR